MTLEKRQNDLQKFGERVTVILKILTLWEILITHTHTRTHTHMHAQTYQWLKQQLLYTHS